MTSSLPSGSPGDPGTSSAAPPPRAAPGEPGRDRESRDAGGRERDQRYMGIALDEARLAEAEGEVPVGAIVVRAGRVVARGHNVTHTACDPTGHAEILAIRAAAAELGHARLLSCTLYTTVEPCFMCAGALSQARVERVVFGVRDPKFGGCVSLGAVLTDPRLNHRAELAEGIRADEARELLQRFFRARRAAANRSPRSPSSPSSSERCQSG